MQEDDDIPLLTEVHALPTQVLANTFNVTPDLIAMIAAEIRPQIAAEIEHAVTQKVKDEVRQELLDYLSNASAEIKDGQTDAISGLKQQHEQFTQHIIAAQQDAEQALKKRNWRRTDECEAGDYGADLCFCG